MQNISLHNVNLKEKRNLWNKIYALIYVNFKAHRNDIYCLRIYMYAYEVITKGQTGIHTKFLIVASRDWGEEMELWVETSLLSVLFHFFSVNNT